MKEHSCISFPPVTGDTPRLLLLGSMPGAESLRQQQYYAFRYNVFWRIMGEIFTFSPELPYEERCGAIRARGIALWDVLGVCERKGSLDNAIRLPAPNDIARFLAAHPSVVKICCNGNAAGNYLRRFFPALTIPVATLPSTSPAAASIPYSRKLAAWRMELDFLTTQQS